MNRNRNRLVFFLLALIFAGFLVLSIMGYQDYSYQIEDDLEQITELIARNIKLEIEAELIKPVYVAKLIANTMVLSGMTNDSYYSQQIIDYMCDITDEYEYESAYYISHSTHSYYDCDGNIVQLSQDNPDDSWFYEFIESGEEYELYMNSRPSFNEDVLLYVNYAVYENENIIGVAGLGIELSEIQDILSSHQEELGGDVYLMNDEGTIQIHSNSSYEGQPYDFADDVFMQEQGFMEEGREEVHIYSPEDMYFDDMDYEYEYMIGTYYISDINLTLVVQKDYYMLLDDILFYQRIRTIIIFSIAFLLITILVISIANVYHKKNIKLVKTDYLTDTYNRKAFDDALKSSIDMSRNFKKPITLAIIDVDNFKSINDVYGHVEGDKILINTATHLKSFTRTKDVLARWGGDEFAIIFSCSLDETKMILARIKEAREKNEMLEKYGITFSIGITEIANEDTVKSFLSRADEALYKAKEAGKNRVCDI